MADPSLDSNPKVNLSTKQQQRNAKIGMGFLLQQVNLPKILIKIIIF
jgi:hypothetical protein